MIKSMQCLKHLGSKDVISSVALRVLVTSNICLNCNSFLKVGTEPALSA